MSSTSSTGSKSSSPSSRKKAKYPKKSRKSIVKKSSKRPSIIKKRSSVTKRQSLSSKKIHSVFLSQEDIDEINEELKQKEENEYTTRREKRILTDIRIGQRYELTDGKIGFVRFIGRTEFGNGIYFGIEVELPHSGKHNGTVNNITYFSAPEKQGLFVKQNRFLKPLEYKAYNYDTFSLPNTDEDV